MTDQLTLINPDGQPVLDVAGPDHLRLELVTDRPNAPDTITVEVSSGAETESVELVKVVTEDGTTVYQSKPFTLDDDYGILGWSGDLGLDYRDGESITFSEGDTSTAAFGYHKSAHRDIAVSQAHLAAAERNWVKAYQDLQSFEQTPEVVEATGKAKSWLDYIRFLRAEMAVVDEDNLGPEAYLARGIIRSVPLDPIAHYQSGAGRMHGSDRDAWQDWTNARRAGHKRVRRDGFTQMWSDIAIGSYQMITDYTGTAQLYTIVTGTSVMGEDVGTSGRWEAAGDLALGYVVGKFVDVGVTKTSEALVDGASVTIGRVHGGRRDGPPAGRPLGSNPKADATGAHVDHNAYGIRDPAARRYRAVTDKFGVHVAVRGASKDAMVYQGMGAPGKDIQIKNKTVTEVDEHIGGPTTSGLEHGPDNARGLVGAFRPELPHRPDGLTDDQWNFINAGITRPDGMSDADWAAMADDYKQSVTDLLRGYRAPGVPDHIAAKIPGRFAQRMREHAETAGKLKKLEEQGLIEIRDGKIIDTGLYGNTGMPVTGDYDLFAIVDADGNPVPLHVAKEVVAFLQKFPETLTLHGAHVDWPKEMPFKSDWERTDVYDAIIKSHETEALIVFGGTSGGTPVATHSRNGVLITKNADGKLVWQRQAPVPYRHGEVLDSGEIHLVDLEALGQASVKGLVSGTTKTLTDDAASGDADTEDIDIDEWIEQQPGAYQFDQSSDEPDDYDPFQDTEDEDEPETAEETDAEDEESDTEIQEWIDQQPGAYQFDQTSDEPDDYDPFEETEDEDEAIEETEDEPEPAAAGTNAGGLPGWLWPVAAAVVAFFVILVIMMSGGGSTPSTTSPVAAADPSPATTSGTSDDETPASTSTSTTAGSTVSTGGGTTGSSGVPSSGTTVAEALVALIAADAATFGLLQNYADIMTAFALAWNGSPEAAFQLFDIRRIGNQSRHPDGQTTGTADGATDVVKVSGTRTSMSQSDVDDRFNNSDFPCGEGAVAHTFCPTGVGDFPAGEVILISTVVAAGVPLDAEDRSYQYLVGFDDGDGSNNLSEDPDLAGNYAIDTDRQYTLTYDASSGWSFVVTAGDDEVPSAARWILRGDAMVLAIPASELAGSPTYRLAMFENAGDLDLTNTDDWAADAVPNVGAQLLPIIPLEPPSVIEVGSVSDATGDAATCGDGAAATPVDIVELTHLRRGREALMRITTAADVLPPDGGSVSVVITLDHPGGTREWVASASPSVSRLTPDDPGRGENPRVFGPFDNTVEINFDNDVPSGSELTVQLTGPDEVSCDTVVYTTP